ncbi:MULTISPECIES: HI1450 family dsDNA-mimic protein [unclassified Pseudoalteromonas]|nr:HI1450 family dsDNA-mimic protein [Pseudoalteromonas sp. MMG013]
MSARLSSVEEITHQAYDIFLQLAPENLSEQDIQQFNEHHGEYGFIEDSEPDDDWQQFVSLEIEPEHFIQVIIGIEYEDGDEVFARILISRDMDAPFCHVLWKQEKVQLEQ